MPRLLHTRILAVALFTLLAVGVARAAQPSFDCKAARTWTEQTICGDDTLAVLDQELAAAFGRRRAQLADISRGQLIAEQRRWLRNRDECRTSTSPTLCLERQYRDRIDVLEPGMHARAPEPAPSSADEALPTATGSLAQCSGSASGTGLCLDRLLAAATTAFGAAEAAMLQRLEGIPTHPANPEAAGAFRNSQKAFLHFRDMTCRWRGALAGGGGSSVVQACLVDYTRARAAEIHDVLR